MVFGGIYELTVGVFDIIDGVLDGHDLFRRIVRDFTAELFFEGVPSGGLDASFFTAADLNTLNPKPESLRL